MNLKFSVKRFGPAFLAFFLAVFGVLLLVPKNGDEVKATLKVPVVVAGSFISNGASASQVRENAVVRMVPENIRAVGAFTSIDEIPEGVLAYSHVVGQQILETSFSVNQLVSLGAGYVAVSIRVESERWVGPYVMSGNSVDIFDTQTSGATLISPGAIILGMPETSNLETTRDTVISLGVKKETLAAVLVAASENRIWLVSA